ncbi:MAG: hypothetical protein A3J38_03840 [Gammaproteobacteria bacterium RIFCSPHIGHO2_12_FULL_45_9]|nr:MAG: hypothetical protein A3J38_03840 [Gammaproteobacteria bacterium RIFCSPHIGHO2_12_FULL_45_9]
MKKSHIILKKHEEKRLCSGHPWIYSNEINTTLTPLKNFTPGEEVLVQAHDQTLLGRAYINPHSLIAARLFSRDPHCALDVAFLTEHLAIALALRTRLFDQPFYRLVYSEADNLPGVVIDRFGDHLVMQINTAGMDCKQTLLGEALLAVLPNTASILLRNDSAVRRQEGLEQYVKPLYGTPPDSLMLVENQVPFEVPLLNGQKTGWFFDHRLNRARLTCYIQNRTVLDVCSYLGGFGIQAGVYGASRIDCIESSASACEWIMKNAVHNHIQDKVSTLCADAFDTMKELILQKKTYDVIILDPPAFVKKSKDMKPGLTAYQRLNELALTLLAQDGILITCSCSMQVSMNEFMGVLHKAAYKSRIAIQVLERGHQGPDHPLHIAIPETDYLKAVFLRKLPKMGCHSERSEESPKKHEILRRKKRSSG